MNILLSLLIYNPIEVYSMILLCDIITGNRTRICVKNIILIYTLSSINFCVQYVPVFVYESSLFIVFNVFCNYFIVPNILFLFYRKIGGRIEYWSVFIVQFVNCTFVLIVSFILNIIGICELFYNTDIFKEFVSNMIIFGLQILLYTLIINNRRLFYEKFRKNRS